MDNDVLICYVNGKKVEERNPSPETTLLQFLRQKLHLTGTKNGCNQGACGACTVMLSRYHPEDKRVSHMTVNSCITPLCSVHGYAITTVEGVGNTKTGLHPLQESLVKSHGIQCGFCTPGMVMSLYCLLRNKMNPTQTDVERVLEGNLCRCTGYRPIVESMKPFYDCPMGDQCCQNKDQSSQVKEEDFAGDDSAFRPNDSSQVVIFPPELKKEVDNKTIKFKCGNWTWIRPLHLKDVAELKSKNKEAKLVLGSTSMVYPIKKGDLKPGMLISCNRVSEMNVLTMTEEGAEIGAAVTLSALREFFQAKLTSLKNAHAQMIAAFLECIRWIAVDQVRNSATIGGHVVCADPLSDLNPLLMSVGAEVKVLSEGKSRRVPLDDKFFIGRYKTSLTANDIVESIIIPFKATNQHTQYFKTPPRRGFSYAIVNGAFHLVLTNDNKIETMRLCFGGVNEKTFQAKKSAEVVTGQTLNGTTVTKVVDALSEELLQSNKDVDKYNLTLACSFVFKFFCDLSVKQNKETSDTSAVDTLTYKPCESMQVFEAVPESQSESDSVGRPVPNLYGANLVSGEAQFLDDMPRYENELFLYPVLSTKAHAKLLNVDTSEALKCPGVIEFLDHTKIPTTNKWGLAVQDEEYLASEKVESYGQMIGGILAESREQAAAAAKLVKIEYADLKPILTIQDAIEAKSFYPYTSAPLKRGDVKEGFANAENILEGQVETSAQDHMYMETMSALVVPKIEQNEMEVYAGVQNASKTQEAVATILGIPRNKVIARHKRTGGAFGGKETNSVRVIAPTAIGAARTGRPVRCVLERTQNFANAGKAHPFLIKYKVAYTSDGKITALEMEMYSNGGFSYDLTSSVMDVAQMSSDGCYNIPHFLVTGVLCKTNTTSNTAFRGFGAQDAVLGIETAISDVAHALGKRQEEVRVLNLYKENDVTICNMTLTNFNADKCLSNCKAQSDFETKLKQITEFNRIIQLSTRLRPSDVIRNILDLLLTQSKWKKRGIAIMPLKFSVGYFFKFLNQGSCLIHVYLDGSVLLSHGGCEMGQGLNTKIIQIASRALGLPKEKIYTSDTATSYSPNASTTSGSTTTDIIGAAVLNACTELRARLKPLQDNMPEAAWEQLVVAAYFSRISLSVIGYGTPQDNEFDLVKGTGVPFNYYTYGAACTSVEIDCLTGEHQVLSTDIVMDVGKSINPAIDIGQIEGGFLQGYGLIAVEEIKHRKDGVPLNSGPLNYKIPGVRSIPREFRVSLLKDCPNTKAIYSSKGIGEPPMLLSVSVYLAIKEAVTAFRKENGMTGRFQMDCPMTTERIRMACQDYITKKVLGV